MTDSRVILLMAAICLIYSTLVNLTLCCHAKRRRTPAKKPSTIHMCIRDNCLELPVGRTFGEFLSQTKSSISLNKEKKLYETFVEETKIKEIGNEF